MTNKTVLITGVGGGIGRACVHHFAGRDWNVIGVDSSDFGDGFPVNGRFIKADISHPDSAELIFQQAKRIQLPLWMCW
jgi:NAD(P)-dependent dehydrogenase (short-subunit alcohol dehydrogenase family)